MVLEVSGKKFEGLCWTRIRIRLRRVMLERYEWKL